MNTPAATTRPGNDWEADVRSTGCWPVSSAARCPGSARIRRKCACCPQCCNEEAVAAFLGRRIGFLDIVETVEETMSRANAVAPRSIAEVIDIDRHARAIANDLMREMAA
jgi:1-deoxy-D-xylulose 5-phosphate reductoisomerase